MTYNAFINQYVDCGGLIFPMASLVPMFGPLKFMRPNSRQSWALLLLVFSWTLIANAIAWRFPAWSNGLLYLTVLCWFIAVPAYLRYFDLYVVNGPNSRTRTALWWAAYSTRFLIVVAYLVISWSFGRYSVFGLSRLTRVEYMAALAATGIAIELLIFRSKTRRSSTTDRHAQAKGPA